MFLLSLLWNKESYNTQILQCVNDTIFRKRFRVPGFGTGSGTLEPVPWNWFLRQITMWTLFFGVGYSERSEMRRMDVILYDIVLYRLMFDCFWYTKSYW